MARGANQKEKQQSSHSALQQFLHSGSVMLLTRRNSLRVTNTIDTKTSSAARRRTPFVCLAYMCPANSRTQTQKDRNRLPP
mmetsp:Transcript_17575/g.24539  ORF Transcript_17575/g.24539 Transcript_17575/m.24539 type:complete len:81 (-) Transcript_17575:539-781(-)